MGFPRAGFGTVGNTTKLVAHIQADIERLISLEVVSPRTGSMILKELRTATRDLDQTGRTRLHKALGDLGDYFKRVRPRSIRLTSVSPPVIILTDAASEDSGSSVPFSWIHL